MILVLRQGTYMDEPVAEASPRRELGLIPMTAGFLLIAEAIGIAVLSVGEILRSVDGIGVMGLLFGAALGWAGKLLAGFGYSPAKGKSAAMLLLGINLAVGFLMFVVLPTAICAVNCGTGPLQVSRWPLLILAFNIACAIVLWRRKPA